LSQANEPAHEQYPHGRGYGHDYMRGGEVFGGYGYAEREEYARPRGEIGTHHVSASSQDDARGEHDHRS
jgi:hypothetical protein